MKPIYSILLLLCMFMYACNGPIEEPKRGAAIASFEPTTAKARDTITIHGESFKIENTNVVIFSDDRIAHVVDWNATQLKVLVPDSGVVDGPIRVRVGVHEIAVSKQSFTIDDSQPVIISITPDHGLPGNVITIKAANLSEDKLKNKVFFGEAEATILSLKGMKMEVEIPRNVADGEVEVIVESDGVASEPKTFEVGTIFKDDFNRTEALGDDWRVIAGTWEIASQYVSNKGGGSMLYNVNNALLEVGEGHSFKLSADVRIDIAAGTCFAGFIFNAQDENQFYLLRINGEGLVQLLATADAGANWPGVFYSGNVSILGGPDFYRVEIASDTLGVFRVKISKKDDILFEEVIADPEARYNGGYAGLWSLDDHSQFDNFYLILK